MANKKLQLLRNQNVAQYTTRNDAIAALYNQLTAATTLDGEIAMVRYTMGGEVHTVVGVVSNGTPTILADEFDLDSIQKAATEHPRVFPFTEIITSSQTIQTSGVTSGEIHYLEGNGCFACYNNGKYYHTWLFGGYSNEDYNDGETARTDRLYLETYNFRLYAFNTTNGNFVEVGGEERASLNQTISTVNTHTARLATITSTLESKADLDSDGKVPASQLPSYVDDVVEYASKSSFPSTGETGKIYVAKDTNKTYRWSGTQYVEISASLALGETAGTAYAGNKGAAVASKVEEHSADIAELKEISVSAVVNGGLNVTGSTQPGEYRFDVKIADDAKWDCGTF